ncbi:hypothetical protein AGMMS49944_10380 [Spirochaetia bacterium]|nr:hypothetical protein AGMMS49944_10380 [Spirochaetia bacterium]
MGVLNELLMSELAKLQESAKVGTGDYTVDEPSTSMACGNRCFGSCTKMCANTVR